MSLTPSNNVSLDPHKAIGEIIGNASLAASIDEALSRALACSFVRLGTGRNPWEVFKRSLHAAIRDIETHPRGKLFRRLVEYGHHHPDQPKALTSNGQTILSDVELGECVEFIYSHMVNRFKGELAELLALDPCCSLVDILRHKRKLPAVTLLYWGEIIQERRYRTWLGASERGYWGGFAKGADGLLVEPIRLRSNAGQRTLMIHGVIEVKSLVSPWRKVVEQVDRHIARLRGGLRLGEREWRPQDVGIASPRPVRVVVQPSTWKLSRELGSQKYEGQALRRAIFRPTSDPEVMISPQPVPPSQVVQTDEVEPDLWKIELQWSQEALAHAAFEMTFWYMGQVGQQIYLNKPKPHGWEYMTPEEVGFNRIKEVLRNAPLRPLTVRQYKRAIWLYNIYCFGYPVGADNKEMIFLLGEGKQAEKQYPD